MDPVTLGLIIAGLGLLSGAGYHIHNVIRDKKKDKTDQEVAKLKSDVAELQEQLKEMLDPIPLQIQPDQRVEVPADFEVLEEKAKALVDRGGQIDGAELIKLGNVLLTKGQLDRAKSYYEVALHQAEDQDNQALKGAALGNIGLIYQTKGDLDQALKYLQEALEIHREVEYRQGEANQLGNIGLIYKNKGDLDQALKYLRDALVIFEECGMKALVEQTKNNIAVTEAERKQQE